jgi:DNA polymerase-3 subunit gamma/tau
MAVLYRKYRPQVFADVVGQTPIITTLMQAVARKSPSHAYVFTGSRGVGKTSVARILAKALNCPNVKAGEPCGVCEICVSIAQGNFLDLLEVDAASNTGVDNVRELIEHVRFSPTQGVYKVFIIDEVHMLSKAAFNALLKTLEEPPTHTVFILATTEIHKLPLTIISRAQRFDFRPLSDADVVRHLEGVAKKEKLTIHEDVYRLIANQAGGSLRDALSVLEKLRSTGDKINLKSAQESLGVSDIALVQELSTLIFNKDAGNIPSFFDRLLATGVDYSLFCKDILEYLRAVLVYKISGQGHLEQYTPEVANILEIQKQAVTTAELLFVIRLFLRAYKEFSSSPSAELPVLIASLEASLRGQSNPPVNAPAVVSPQIQTATKESKEVNLPPQALKDLPKENAPLTEAQATLVTVSLPEIRLAWPEVITAIKEQNSPLATLVKNSPIVELENGKIVVGVKYLFHKEHLESTKNRALVKEVLLTIFGQPLGFSAQVQKDILLEVGPVEALADALKVFGGELVD